MRPELLELAGGVAAAVLAGGGVWRRRRRARRLQAEVSAAAERTRAQLEAADVETKARAAEVALAVRQRAELEQRYAAIIVEAIDDQLEHERDRPKVKHAVHQSQRAAIARATRELYNAGLQLPEDLEARVRAQWRSRTR